MREKTARDNRALIEFWDKAFSQSEEAAREERPADPDGWKGLAPSDKLFRAAAALGARERVLDYGCGSGWGAVIAAKSGCPDVTAADAAPGAVRAAGRCAALWGVTDRVRPVCAEADWLRSVPSDSFDGFLCSNVLDVVPPETAEEIIRESARILKRGGEAVIGLNYYLSPEAAAERKMELTDGRMLYLDGVLRLVSRTDEEWADLFSPYYRVGALEHFAWPGEKAEARRLFRLRRRED
ncbi:MAG: class I SAM-dependent methyltransferase [Clostridia bacterium]|nr:class I SAM-dependent methyltransferase [Clostridia bacterium]